MRNYVALAWLHNLAVTQLVQPAGSSQAATARRVGVECLYSRDSSIVTLKDLFILT
jgi:hypothetical protein